MLRGDRAEAPVEITSFEECVEAGNPVMESYPRQCRTEDGQLFVEEIDLEAGETVQYEGVVTEVDASQAVVDGPFLISLEIAGDTMRTIAVPSMGINLCAAQDSIVDIAELSAGDEIEVRGKVDEENRIVPCDEDEHYLRLVE